MRSPPKYLSCQYHLLTLPSGFAILRYRDLCPNNILIKKGCKDVKYLIKDGLVLSSKISNGFYKSHVLIEDDVISYIGQSIPATQVDRVIEAKDCLVIPGLVNAHLHSADHFNKGKFDNLPLELWMPLLRPFYSGIGISKDDIYLRTLFGCIEMLKTGTTCIIDDVVQSPFDDEEKLDAIMQAYKKAGIRAYVTTHVSDKSIEDTIPYLKEQFSYYNINAPQPSDTEDIISYVESKLKKYNVNGAVQKYAVAPSGPQRCTDELLVSLSNLSLKYKVPAVCHTLETYVQKKTGDYFYNKTLVKRLYDLKAINQYSNLIHCVWVTDEDIELKLIIDKDSFFQIDNLVIDDNSLIKYLGNMYYDLRKDIIDCPVISNIDEYEYPILPTHNVPTPHIPSYIGSMYSYEPTYLDKLEEKSEDFKSDIESLFADSIYEENDKIILKTNFRKIMQNRSMFLESKLLFKNNNLSIQYEIRSKNNPKIIIGTIEN